MSLAQTVRDIKSVKIQGAQHIAFSALDAIREVILSSRATIPRVLLHDLVKAKHLLDNARPTEPLLRNYTAGITHKVDTTTIRTLKESLLANIARLRKEHRDNIQHMIEMGEQKVPKGSTIFTHCHSSTVTAILMRAHDRKKHIVVTNTEARPLFQGRITAQELAKAGIPVHHFVDSAVHEALRHADMMLIGADAITPYAVINKVGSRLFAEVAKKMGVPVYVCAHALKLDPQTIKGKKEPIERRSSEEVWLKPPRNVMVHNAAFDEVEPSLIDGIISELGIFPHSAFIEEVRRAYPWIFD